MLKNYLVTILRQIQKNKVFSFINIFGLALGMAACLVIAQYVNFHTSFDKFHSNSENIFRIEGENFLKGESLGKSALSPGLLATTLAESSPQVENAARFYNYNYANNTIIYKDGDDLVSFEQSGVYGAEKTAFDLFDFSFVAGSAERFNEPQTAILTLSASKKYFDDPKDAIGNRFTLSGNNGQAEFELIGVLDNLPKNSHIDFELLISFPSLDPYTQAAKTWNYPSMLAYIYLNDPTKTEEVLSEIDELFKANGRESYQERGYGISFELLALKDIHLNSEATTDFTPSVDNKIVFALSLIAVVILVIAWINYMNLSLVRTIKRLKEVGVRKCMGSSLKQITSLFILEAFVMNLISFAVALIGIQVFERYLLDVTGLPISALMNIEIFLVLSGLVIAGTILIGFYPYALLKTMNIANVLVNQRNRSGGTGMRKSLVFVQFLITVMMIAGTLTIYKQITYMRAADLGIDIENTLVIQSPPGAVQSDDRQDVARFNTLKTELLKYPGVKQITSGGEIPGQPIGWGASFYLKNQSKENSIPTGLISMDFDFTNFFDIDIVAGRALQRGDDPWTRGDVVINEKMTEMLGFNTPEEAIGAELDGFYGPTLKVVGVTENYHHTSLHDDYTPTAYILSSWTEFYFIKLGLDESSDESLRNQLTSLVETVESEWGKVYGDYQMDYFFLDKAFDEQYQEDVRFGKIFSGFSSLAIIIACLGLFGLTSFTIQQRTKEIGIRKVLGASVQHLMMLLSKEYIVLVGIACVISLPIAWWLMSKWLLDYTFRIELGWWFFIVPVASILVLAFLSILSKILTTIKTNPVESLRYE